MLFRRNALAGVLPGLLLSLGFAAPAQALIISDDMNSAPAAGLGWSNSYPWSGVIFSGTSMLSSGGALTMTTAPVAGLWFGNASALGYNPGWDLGTNASGNYLSLTTSFSAGAADWDTYFYDKDGFLAGLQFNPAGGYGYPVQSGFNFYSATVGNVSQTTFVPFDLTDGMHTFEILLKNGLVSYSLDGSTLFSGSAWLGGVSNLLLIGDGTGSTQTGTGQMFVDHVLVDTAPTANVSVVPVPTALLLFVSGLAGLAGISRPRRRLV